MAAASLSSSAEVGRASLLSALTLVVDSGVNLKGENHLETNTEQIDKADDTIAAEGTKKESTEVQQEERNFEEALLCS